MSPDRQVSTPTPQTRWVKLAAAFLAVSYGVGAPVAAFLEFSRHLLSARFHYPPVLIYVVCAVQAVCAVFVLIRRLAPGTAVVLTVTTVGALASHVRIGSPPLAADGDWRDHVTPRLKQIR
jgi:uncharacterized membrane protein YphA (DoxX/SURF4 family)